MKAVGLVSGGGCHLGLTQDDLRDAMGLSSVHVNRTLQKLRAWDPITFGQGRLNVLDVTALARLGDVRSDYLHQHSPLDSLTSSGMH